MLRKAILACALAGAMQPLCAAQLTVHVVDASDHPVRDAVVALYPAASAARPTKHHVYSFSPAKKFELKLLAQDQSRTVHFDQPGVVALGCNIHDQISAFMGPAQCNASFQLRLRPPPLVMSMTDY